MSLVKVLRTIEGETIKKKPVMYAYASVQNLRTKLKSISDNLSKTSER